MLLHVTSWPLMEYEHLISRTPDPVSDLSVICPSPEAPRNGVKEVRSTRWVSLHSAGLDNLPRHQSHGMHPIALALVEFHI